MKILSVSVVALLVVGCAAQHAPRVSCSGRLEEINPPRSPSTSSPAESAKERAAP